MAEEKENTEPAKENLSNKKKANDLAKEALSIAKEQLEIDRDLNDSLKDRIKSLSSIIKANEAIITKIKAANNLTKDLKTIQTAIFKQTNLRNELESKFNKLSKESITIAQNKLKTLQKSAADQQSIDNEIKSLQEEKSIIQDGYIQKLQEINALLATQEKNENPESVKEKLLYTNKVSELAKETLTRSKEQLQVDGDIDGSLKERVKSLSSNIKANEAIIAKIKAANDLNEDVKSIEADIFKQTTLKNKLQIQLNQLDKEAIVNGQIKVKNLQKAAADQERIENEIKNLQQEKSRIQEGYSEKLNEVTTLLARQEEDRKYASGEELASLNEKITFNRALVDSLNSQLKLSIKKLGIDEKITELNGINNTINQNKLTNEEALAEALVREMALVDQNLAMYMEQDMVQRDINKKMGLTGTLVKGVGGLLAKVGLDKHLNMDLVLKKMKQAAAKDGPLGAMKVAAGEFGAAIGEALKSPVTYLMAAYAVIKKMVTSAIEYQSKAFEAAKNIGIGVKESEKLFENFQNIAWQNSKLALTAKQLVETYAQLSNTLGFLGPQNEEFLTTTTGIQRRLNVSAEDMQNLQMFSVQTGKTLQQSYGTLVATAKIEGMRQKIQLSERQILQGISKISATVFNNFKGNVVEISKAVVQATKFGTSLDQINQAGMSLLDFESSISKEFEAQLLTGRDINLAKAREAALTGDTNQLMTEITTQLGTQAQWGKMNVIQQQSLAEAFGLSKEAVDEMYRKQALAAALGEQANASQVEQYNLLLQQEGSHAKVAEIMGQKAANEALSASVQDKMAATMERINDNIGKMSQALMPIIEGFANMVSNATSLKILLGGAAVIAVTIATSSILAANAKRQELQTQTLINIGQLRELQTKGMLTAEEFTLATTKTVGAGASIIGTLGVFGIPIAMAVITALMAYLASSGAGGSAISAPAIPAPSTSPESMGSTPPTAQTPSKSDQQVMGASERERATTIIIESKTSIDGQQISSDNTNKIFRR